MTIELITQEEHEKLLDIQKEFPALTFQNEGYQYIQKSKLTEEDLSKWKEVEEILKKSIKGFREFNNFKLDKNNEIVIRIQYRWDADNPLGDNTGFTGVGYILLDELLSGFKKEDKDG